MKRDYAVVATISGLTKSEAIDIQSGIAKVKFKRSPNSRGTIGFGKDVDIGKLLSKGQKQIRGGK